MYNNKQFADLCKMEQHYYLRFTNKYPQMIKATHLSYQQIYKMCKQFENGKAKIINIPKEIFSVG